MCGPESLRHGDDDQRKVLLRWRPDAQKVREQQHSSNTATASQAAEHIAILKSLQLPISWNLRLHYTIRTGRRRWLRPPNIGLYGAAFT